MLEPARRGEPLGVICNLYPTIPVSLDLTPPNPVSEFLFLIPGV